MTTAGSGRRSTYWALSSHHRVIVSGLALGQSIKSEGYRLFRHNWYHWLIRWQGCRSEEIFNRESTARQPPNIETVGSENVEESCVRTVCTYEWVRTYVYIRCWDITYGRCIYGAGTYIVYLTTWVCTCIIMCVRYMCMYVCQYVRASYACVRTYVRKLCVRNMCVCERPGNPWLRILNQHPRMV